jgi:membrane-bound serine protease (ClpP class)
MRHWLAVIAAGWLASAALLSASASPTGTQPFAEAPAGRFDRAVLIPIKDEITEITTDSVKRRIKQVRAERVPVVIFELDTPGGAGGPMLDICHLIKALRDDGVKTYAWVDSEAYSAGTIIALATDGILMSGNARIGDCKPIRMGEFGPEGLPESIEAKVTSPIMAELRDSARRNGYSWNLVQSLVREKVEPFWVVNASTGEKRFVTASERDTLFGISEATSQPAHGGPISKTAWKYVEEAPGIGQVRQPVVGERELLTMTTGEAQAYGFAMGKASNEDDLRSELHIAGPIQRMEITWTESAVAWLASPAVRGVLFLVVLLGAYAEFQHPGLSLPGAVAAVGLVLFLGAPYMAGFTVTWEILAILLGIVLLGLEIFVIPGFGLPGVLGVGLLAVGLLGSFVPTEPGAGNWPHWPALPGSFTYMRQGLWALAGGLSGSLVGMVLLARYMPKVPVAGRLILANPTRAQIETADPYEGLAQVGDVGRSEGPLRPAGKARFGAMLVDVVTEGDYIEKGLRIEVTERRGSRVVVRRVD